MLKKIINTHPQTKFVLITDSLEYKDSQLFDHLLSKHTDHKNEYKIHYCVFEGVYKRAVKKYESCPNIILHNFVAPRGDVELDDFEQFAERMGDNNAIVINSLAGAILKYGVHKTYRTFNCLTNNKAIKQIITVLHKDLIEGDSTTVVQFFSHLSSLCIGIEPKFSADSLPRLQYLYKKSGGKVVSQIEEYRFEGQQLITTKIEKPEASKLLEKSIPEEVNPEGLSTFRIGLTDEEKISRDKVVLPYLPSESDEKPQEEGEIFYQLDAQDDWDEEDPDDDLDF